MTQPLTISNTDTEQAESQDSRLREDLERLFVRFGRPSFAAELNAVFDNLPDEELLNTLESERWTGRPGYPIRVMWQTLVASYVLEIPTIQELIRTLERDLVLCILCGIWNEQQIPTRFTYYRFLKKLLSHIDLVERCMAKTIEHIQEQLPGFGEVICVDSTHILSYANSYKKPASDPDAKWSKKTLNGDDYWWLGYKMQLASTKVGNEEIPLSVIVTPAKVNDIPMMIPLLNKVRRMVKGFSPKYILGDKGYDAMENHRVVVEDFKAIPIIDLNLRGLKGKPPRFEDLANEYGTPYCAYGIPYQFWGYDKKQERLKYRCPLACGKSGCPWLEKCSESGYGQVVKLKPKDDYRRFIQVPRHTKKWRQLYNMRTSVERIFSRLKKDGGGRLVNHRLRGLGKITLNCLLSVWVMQVSTLASKE